MAIIPENNEPKPLRIGNFYGLNLPKSGDTQIALGESGNMNNCYITKDHDLSKANGYLQMMTQVADKRIQGMWHGDIGGTNYFIFAINGKLYKFNSGFWLTQFDGTDVWSTVTTEIGSITDAPTQFFAFSDKLYILTGSEYKSYDGTALADVAGYVPKLRIGCAPLTGVGTDFEEINVLTGKKHQTYNSDGTSVYQLAETAVDSVDSVYVDGVLKTVTTHYTVNLTTGKITFTSGNIPATGGLDNVDIYWTKGSGNRDVVIKNRFAFLFGLAADTRVFLYGHTDNQNVRVFSSLAAGVPSAEYFTEAAAEEIGSASTPITGMARQQNIMLVFKTNETYYSYYDSVNLDGIDIVTFPTPIINSTRGNVAIGQAQVLMNDPFTIDRQLIKWYPTSEKNERNMKDMGRRIQKDLDTLDLSDCIMIDKENSSELWIANGKKVWVYRYDIEGANKEDGVFSRMVFPDTITSFVAIGNDLFFGTDAGYIMKINETYLTYNGTTIDSHWEMNMYDWGAPFIKKTLKKAWITLAAQPKVSVDIQYATDRNAYSTPITISYETITFGDTHFDNFTFYTNYNPQTKYVRLKAKKWKILKIILDNESATDTFVVLELNIKAEYGGESK
ncbi:MAG: hypothetical protein RBR68_15040 [Tenuifilaceae bacterium]|nr:hypothetical protein [Tenuifilaceae bacterium]